MSYDYMMALHALWWVFWIAVVIALIFWGRGGASIGRDLPREIPHEVLRRRLANGEISTEEYDKRKVIPDQDA